MTQGVPAQLDERSYHKKESPHGFVVTGGVDVDAAGAEVDQGDGGSQRCGSRRTDRPDRGAHIEHAVGLRNTGPDADAERVSATQSGPPR